MSLHGKHPEKLYLPLTSALSPLSELSHPVMDEVVFLFQPLAFPFKNIFSSWPSE